MISIFFIIDGTRMEAQVALLASTLFHHNADSFAFIGYVSDKHRSALNPSFLQLMTCCRVEVRRLPGPSDVWARPFPHGNKILAATDWRDSSHSLFLDSDIICTSPLDLADLIRDRSIAVAPEGKPTWGKDISAWQSVYDHFDLPLPEDRVTLRRGRRRQFLPYFNAGVILFPEGPIVDERGFGKLWLETALAIDHRVAVHNKRPWLDQISLPVTLKRFGLGYTLAHDCLNYSISDRGQISNDTATLIHYHSFRDLAVWDGHRQAALGQTAQVAGEALFATLTAIYAEWWHCPPLDQPPADRQSATVE